MSRVRSRLRPWFYIVAIMALGVGSALLYAYLVNRVASVEFSRVAGMKYEDALAEIRRHRGSATFATFDKKPVEAIAVGLPPGQGCGMNPRFFNVGDTRAAIYRGKGGEWFVLGKFKVLEYANGQWREIAIIQNQRFTYHARK